VTPEDHFRDGLSALGTGRPAEAADHFQHAISTEKNLGAVRPQMRYVSFYGLSMALSKRSLHAAVDLCERAAARDTFDAVLMLNLGRVYVLTGRRIKALATFERGLHIDPSNRRIKSALSRLDRRRAPAWPSLGRDHAVNRSLGRLRASFLGPRRHNVGE
jgi:tetratricopeptide (TPR) repeat protein